jgi:hypothetical protein
MLGPSIIQEGKESDNRNRGHKCYTRFELVVLGYSAEKIARTTALYAGF